MPPFPNQLKIRDQIRELRDKENRRSAAFAKLQRERDEAVALLERIDNSALPTCIEFDPEDGTGDHLIGHDIDAFLARITEPGFSDTDLEPYKTKVYDIQRCPECGGPADNGFSRDGSPIPYPLHEVRQGEQQVTPEQFIKKVKPFEHVPGVGRWESIDTYRQWVRRMSNALDYPPEDALAIVRDALRRALPDEYTVGRKRLRTTLVSWRSTDPVFDAARHAGLHKKPEPEPEPTRVKPIKFETIMDGETVVKVDIDGDDVRINGRRFVPADGDG